MPAAHSIREGYLYWCETARSDIGVRFSDKERRPVLVAAQIGDYAAVYPCSRFRDDMGASEWIGDVYGEADTHVVYGFGLFYVPAADLQTPGVPWPEWAAWKKAQRQVLANDLKEFTARHRERLAAPSARRRGDFAERLTAPLQNLLNAETQRRLHAASQPPPPPPPTPASPAPPPPPKRPTDEFIRAVESLPPYVILKPEDAEANARTASGSSPRPSKRLKRKGRRQ